MNARLSSAHVFLDYLSLKQVPHNTGNLHGHLERTAQRLQDWGFPYEVCAAGLFHSVLGTGHFSQRCLQLHDIPKLQAVIGPYAINLVTLFSVAKRPRGLANALETGRLELLYGGDTPIQLGTASDLVSIEFANLLDQNAEACLMDALKVASLPHRELASSDAVMRSWGALVLKVKF